MWIWQLSLLPVPYRASGAMHPRSEHREGPRGHHTPVPTHNPAAELAWLLPGTWHLPWQTPSLPPGQVTGWQDRVQVALGLGPLSWEGCKDRSAAFPRSWPVGR